MRNEECHQLIRIKYPKHTKNRKKRQRMMRAIINEAIDWAGIERLVKNVLIYGSAIERIYH